MAKNVNKLQAGIGAFLIGCALLILPLTAGVVLLTQVSRDDRQIGAAAPEANRCDLDRNGVVDEEDLNIAAGGFGRVSETSGNAHFDFDSDGWINSADLDAISQNSAVCR